MSSKQNSNGELPRDLLLLGSLFLLSSALYSIFIKPSYLVGAGWLISAILVYLRSLQLTPIRHRMVRMVFWVVGLGLLVAIWWLTLR